ncbi:MAG: serine protease, partial [Isosphaeraceae bacterium]|nr:serine protease [Isosphaeraceae bacterium]
RHGILCTNAHVIDDEFVSSLEVRFPSAPAGKQGPHPAEVLYEDTERDLALLAVETDLPPLRVAVAYAFRKGEDVTVIGNPGAGGDAVLENAITRGVMSTKAKLDGRSFYQLSIAINPGNSGGPVFDSTGQVVGVATLKTHDQEALAFCVPVEDLQTALGKLAGQSASQRDRARSRHRLVTAVHALGRAGAMYCLGIDFRRAAADALPVAAGNFKATSQRIDAAITEFHKDYGTLLAAEVEGVRADLSLTAAERDKFGRLAQLFGQIKTGYREPPAKLAEDALRILKADFRRLLVDLCKILKIDEPPPHLLAAFDGRSAAKGTFFFMIPSPRGQK